MRKLIILSMIVLFLMSTAVLAKQDNGNGQNGNGIGSPTNECQEAGFDLGIVRFGCSGGSYTVSDQQASYAYYTIDVTGDDCQEADWTSDPDVDGVIVKASTKEEIYDGGSSGTVFGIAKDKGAPGLHDISHITFCKNIDEPGCTGNCGGTDVPEFSTVTLVAAVAIAGLGLTLLRRK